MSDNEHIICGIISENDEYHPIYCNPTTGECYFSDGLMGDARVIAEISVSALEEANFEDMLESMQNNAYGPCIGIIFDGETAIKLLSDCLARRFESDDLESPISEVFGIDIYGDYLDE